MKIPFNHFPVPFSFSICLLDVGLSQGSIVDSLLWIHTVSQMIMSNAPDFHGHLCSDDPWVFLSIPIISSELQTNLFVHQNQYVQVQMLHFSTFDSLILSECPNL